MFFNKIKPIKLEMYSPMGQLIDLFPPKPMRESIPEWWTAIDTKAVDGKTVKHCPGFKDLYAQGIGLPLWSDYEIIFDNKEIVDMRWPTHNGTYQPGIGRHDLTIQAPKAWPEYINIKFQNPWKFHCDEPISFVWVQPVWGQKNPQEFILVPGITDFNVNKQVNINTLWKLGYKKVMLKAGTIMAHLIPITDRPLEISYHVMDSNVFNKKFAVWHSTLGLAEYAKNKLILRNKNND